MYTVTLGEVRQERGGFSCNSTTCYSWESPTTNALFLRLQDLLNKAAARLGITTRIKVDGLIGKNTVTLAEKVSDKAGGIGGPLQYLAKFDLEGVGWTKENLARHADVIVPELARFVGESPSPLAPNNPIPVANPSGTPVDPYAGMPATQAPSPPVTAQQLPKVPGYQTEAGPLAPPTPSAGTQISVYMPPQPMATGSTASKVVPAVAIAGAGILAVAALALSLRKKA